MIGPSVRLICNPSSLPSQLLSRPFETNAPLLGPNVMAATPGKEEHRSGSPRLLRRPRLRIPSACQSCRQRKAKCDGGRPGIVPPPKPPLRAKLIQFLYPVCARCHEKGKTCAYNQVPSPPTTDHRARRKPRRHVPILSRPPISASLPTRGNSASKVRSPIQTEPIATGRPFATPESSQESGDLDTDTDPKSAYYTAHGRFSRDIAAAIDERAGVPSTGTSSLVPFVNAPLFGDLDLSCATGPFTASALPPREHADKLVGIYWRHIDPTEPVLDRDLFFQNYNASYSAPPGSSPHGDTCIWLSILNVVFSLAVQRHEGTPLHKRCEESSLYFRRSWALLRPETVLWQPGSVELVQCLMLMSRYLHCTNNRHLTWMTAGLAARIAQSTCCQPPEGAVDSPARRELRGRVWESCLNLDR